MNAATQLALIGVDRNELRGLRTLVSLLRHPDPSVPELARQALLYLSGAAGQRMPEGETAPIGAEQHLTKRNLVS